MAAALRSLLVLELDPSRAGALEELDRPDDVDHVTVALVGVGDHRDRDGGRDALDVCGHLGLRDETHVRETVNRGGAVPAHVHGFEAGLLEDPRDEAAVRTRDDDRLGCLEEPAKPRRSRHLSGTGRDGRVGHGVVLRFVHRVTARPQPA